MPYALVTGACSGIGRCYADNLAGRGYNLVVVSNREQEIALTASQVAAQYGVKVHSVCIDLGAVGAAQQLFDWCEERQLPVEVLVCNAGIFYFGDFMDQPQRQVELMTMLHVVTPTMLCRLFAPKMAAAGGGYMLMMSSLSAMAEVPYITMYSATKAYLRSFARALRYEVRQSGVEITVVSPGGIATDLYRLPPRLQRLGVRLGVLMRPERLADRALNRMFAGKKEYVPGIVNRVFLFLLPVVPNRWVETLKKRINNE